MKKKFPMVNAGFTLIEVLITVTIMLLLVGGGIAAFVTFNERQVVINAARELQGGVRAAQQRAQSATKPDSNCDKLESYAIRAPQSPPVVVDIVAECDTGDTILSSFTLGSSIALTEPLDMSFLVLRGGVVNPSEVTLRSITTNHSYTFEVTTGGEITEGELSQ
jgi:prepilin-type N-terminal cleavage/methylation domain-containing protein